MKLKNSEDITEKLFNKTILDMEKPTDSFYPSEYLFFVKDTSFDNDLNNKLSLIIVDKNNGYVVNNNLKFNSLEIIDNKIVIYSIINNKRNEYIYWIG